MALRFEKEMIEDSLKRERRNAWVLGAVLCSLQLAIILYAVCASRSDVNAHDVVTSVPEPLLRMCSTVDVKNRGLCVEENYNLYRLVYDANVSVYGRRTSHRMAIEVVKAARVCSNPSPSSK